MRIWTGVCAATAVIGVAGCGLMRDDTADAPDMIASARTAPAGTAQTPLEAVTRPLPGESALGASVASLGDPTRSGFWVRTALVDAPVKGRVVNRQSGASVQVDLLPMTRTPGADGAQLSLAAMRLLTPSLTDLPDVMLFAS